MVKSRLWRAPAFWWKSRRSLLSYVFKPLAYPYVWGQRGHRYLFPKRYACTKASCPVISIGSALIGGSGKTPLTLHAIAELREKGFSPIIITRGYGRKKSHLCCKVDPSVHRSSDVGDEALLLARAAPTYVASVRSDALVLLTQDLTERSIILLDDAHQHASLHKDHHILVMHHEQGLGNGLIFPAGPLREPLDLALSRTDTLVHIAPTIHAQPNMPVPGLCPAPRAGAGAWAEPGKGRVSEPGAELERLLLWAKNEGKRVIPAIQHVACSFPKELPVVLFAGLGFPQRFLRCVRDELGLRIAHIQLFPDHWPYSRRDEQALLTLAEKYGAGLLTTEKDCVRLSPTFRRHVQTVSLTLQCELFTDFPPCCPREGGAS